ncbi:Gar1/Naf1 RNA binding region-domain-containing protein [Rhodotorula diobovata]|uniref:H/ACA ribonucleoprotein complex non-core subunit NAF1 n=1 Tax=Rhodotorula diobovata TaxID=5288 RepID=A0A5C5FRL9_9BASI|nr:Gar1/Naf1 RNA binding region-domain-containing protein [Rhodotorula diobovata]
MGQGQSQQRTNAQTAHDTPATTPSQPHPDETPSTTTAQLDDAPAQQTAQETTQQPSVEAPAVPTETAPSAPPLAVAHDAGDSFKVPALPVPAATPSATSPSSTLRALPADIEHILSLGAADPDEAQLAALASASGHARGTSELEQVVRELKDRALQADAAGEVRMEDADERATGDELRKVEDEMRLKGVTREAEVGEVVEMEEGEDVGVAGALKAANGPVKMQDDDSSDSDSDSSSSDSDDTTAAAPASRQRNRRGKQRADSDLDDDDESGVVSSKTAPKTEHEVVEPEVAPPPVQKIDEGAELAKFGKVESVIETVVVVKADTGGDWRVLDEGTVVCWEDRTVIGTIFETFGSVQQPFYSIRFPASSPPDPSVFTPSRAVFYSPNLASFVFTRDLRNLKGSDASNIWDEEVGANEVEFSDDEEEAEYKRRLKADRKARTQSATPGPSGSRSGSRAPSAAVASGPPPSGPPAHLPARPAVSYADTADDFLTPSVPSAAPMGGSGASGNRAMVGTAPPPGRVGRRMFERDTGAALEEGEEVEFEFSSGEGSDDEDEQAGGAFGPAPPSVGRGGRGGRGGAGRGGQRGGALGGRGRGRGRGGQNNSPGGRPIAGLPRGGGGGGGGRGPSGLPAGLPSKPNFEADFTMADADGPSARMSAPSTGGGGSPGMSGAAAPPPSAPSAPYPFNPPLQSGAFTFSVPPSGPSATRSPPTQPQPQPQQHSPRMPWSGAPPANAAPPAGPSAAAGYSPNYGAPPAGGAYGYRAPPAAHYYGGGPPPPAGPSAYGYGPSGSSGSGGSGGGAGGYSPHAPYAAAAQPGPPRAGAASEGYNPIAVQGGGHLNPRFLAAQRAAQQQQQQQGQGQGYYGQAPGPPQGGQGGQGGYGGGQGRW